jgi:chromosome segregation ATPase
MPENTNGNPLAGEPNATQPQAGNQNQNPSSPTPQAGENQSEPKLTKEEFERISKNLHEANSEAKNLRTRLRALEVEKETAEANKLKEAGEFKSLYEQTEARVKELEPVVEENTFLRDYAMKQLEATIKDWPEEVKAFDPGKKAPLQDRLNWLEKSKPLVAKLQGQQLQQRQAGAFRSPLPANQQNGPKTADDYYKEMKAGRPF